MEYIVDIVIGAILVYGLIKGFSKGFFDELASLLSLVLGIYGAIHFSYFLKEILAEHFQMDHKYNSLIAFFGTLIIIILGISLIGKLFTKLAKMVSLGFLNKLLGGLFGVLKLGLLLGVLLGWLERVNFILPIISKEQKEASILYEPTKNLANVVFPKILDKLEDLKFLEQEQREKQEKEDQEREFNEEQSI
ncbi:CvpA family protein [Wenyingzhuangia sp. IMCC45574]